MAIGIGIGLPFRRNIATTLAVPSGLSASFTVDTISGDLSWTDNSGGKAQYEIYSSTNSESYTLLTTTVAGATSYSDTSCRQNASVVYRVRAKYYSLYSDYVTSNTIVTPLCWKTDQSSLNTVTMTTLNIAAGYSVTINWGDSTSNTYSGNNSGITKNYSTTGQFNISMSGDVNQIGLIQYNSQSTSYGDLTNWILPQNCSGFRMYGCSFTGTPSNWIGPTSMTTLYIYSNMFTGATLDITANGLALIYRASSNYLTSSGTTTFRKAMSELDIKNQNAVFPTTEIDKFFKAAADWYQVNAPTVNCTYNLSGTNMGIPTGGASNVDIVRLSGYYTSAGKTATIIVRTS